MKKIIGGKKYDTETAVSIASNKDDRGQLPGGRGWELFRTPKGGFFIAFWTCWDGEKDSIEPKTEQESKEWCEEHQVDGDIIEEYFGVTEEAGPDETVMIGVSRKLRDALKAKCAQQGRQIKETVEAMMKKYIEGEKI